MMDENSLIISQIASIHLYVLDYSWGPTLNVSTLFDSTKNLNLVCEMTFFTIRMIYDSYKCFM